MGTLAFHLLQKCDFDALPQKIIFRRGKKMLHQEKRRAKNSFFISTTIPRKWCYMNTPSNNNSSIHGFSRPKIRTLQKRILIIPLKKLPFLSFQSTPIMLVWCYQRIPMQIQSTKRSRQQSSYAVYNNWWERNTKERAESNDSLKYTGKITKSFLTLDLIINQNTF